VTLDSYVFPPTESGEIKLAIHAPGYLNPLPSTGEPTISVSTPRTKSYGGTQDDQVPKQAVTLLRSYLAAWLPGLACKDFETTRLCW
jgi:sarcosine oxidase/L-pipecolate oxidase